MMIPFYERIAKIDAIILAGPQGQDFVHTIQPLLLEEASRVYFFDSLSDPAWIDVLVQAEQFETPSETYPWPQSKYLARVAKGPEVQNMIEVQRMILNIMLKVSDAQNTFVHENFADAALAMPVGLAAEWIKKEAKWIEHQNKLDLLLPNKLGNLVEHLAKGGQVEAALDLAKTLLAVLPGPQESEAPRIRADIWDYEQILKKNIPALVEAAGEQAFDLLCDFLESAIRYSRSRSGDEELEDYSYVWRNAIESDEQNHIGDLRNLLVSAIRDVAEQVVMADPTRMRTLVKGLEPRRWPVFGRIGFHLLRRFPETAGNLIAGRLTDRLRFDEFCHEYSLLLKDQFVNLAQEDQETILTWIEVGPDLEAFKDGRERWSGQRPSQETAKKHGEYWRWNRLTFLVEALPQEWQYRYDQLVAEFGGAEQRGSDSMEWVGYESPKSADDLNAMSVQEIVGYLRTWQPPEGNWWKRPSPEGLGQELRRAVLSDPKRFAEEMVLFVGCEPSYVRNVIGGFREATVQKVVFPWVGVLDLCRWVVKQPEDRAEDKSGEADDLETDTNWRGTRSNIADLLEEGFKGRETGIPFESREAAWSVLRPLTDDSEPSPDSDQKGDWLTISLNAVRGKAMHTLVRYALWVRRNIEKMPDAKERTARGFEEMPEVRSVLETHLDPEKEQSPSIRTVYGQWVPWLAMLDSEWARKHISTIFPPAEEDETLWKAAWGTYITRCEPYNNVFDVLRDEYSRATDRINTPRDEPVNALSNYEERLAGHLTTFYWRGKVSLDEPGNLLSRFYEKAFELLRGHVIEFAGRALYRDKEDDRKVPAEITDRFKALWAWRVQEAGGVRSKEFEGFGWWFVSGKFDDAWTMEQLAVALRLAGKVEPDHMVVERLATLVEKMPKQVVERLRMIVEGDIERWAIHGWMDHARTILGKAIQGQDSEARAAAVDLVHRLGARGHLEFRDLLTKT